MVEKDESAFRNLPSLVRRNPQVRERIFAYALRSAMDSFVRTEGFEKAVIVFHGGSIYSRGFDQIIQLTSAKPARQVLMIVEAKLVGRSGQLRSYLPIRRSLRCRQMSKTWVRENAERLIRIGYPRAGNEILKALQKGGLERLLVALNYRTGETRIFWEEQFEEQGIDGDLLPDGRANR